MAVPMCCHGIFCYQASGWAGLWSTPLHTERTCHLPISCLLRLQEYSSTLFFSSTRTRWLIPNCQLQGTLKESDSDWGLEGNSRKWEARGPPRFQPHLLNLWNVTINRMKGWKSKSDFRHPFSLSVPWITKYTIPASHTDKSWCCAHNWLEAALNLEPILTKTRWVF